MEEYDEWGHLKGEEVPATRTKMENSDVFGLPGGQLIWQVGQDPGPDWVQPAPPERGRYLFTIHREVSRK